ncbi:MAG: choice-of-anchor D domain-containing protein [Fimbriimonadaceae bacterium]
MRSDDTPVADRPPYESTKIGIDTLAGFPHHRPIVPAPARSKNNARNKLRRAGYPGNDISDSPTHAMKTIRTHTFASLCATLMLLATAPAARAQAAGTLDALDANIAGGFSVDSTTVQPDGKIIIAGDFTSVLGVPRSCIARLNADGSLDMGFDPKAGGPIHCVAVQSDGKILIGGGFTTLQPNGAASTTTRQYIARLHSDGSLDTSFDPKASGTVWCLAVQEDGRILLGGGFFTLQPNGAASATSRWFVARLNFDGSLDTGFDPHANSQVDSIVVQADGKILLGGNFTTLQPNGAASATTRNRIARLNFNGSLDPGFDPNANDSVLSLALQADGKILLGGRFTTLQPNGAASATTRKYIARVNSDGSLDTGFDPKAGLYVESVAVQTDGKILLGGSFFTLQPNGAPSATARQYVARVNADGTLDSAFDPKANGGHVGSVALQADGKVLLGGGFDRLQPNGAAGTTTRYHFARLNNDAAAQSLSAPDATRVQWLRSGTAPEVSQVIFEKSIDGGTNWAFLGNGMRVGTTSNWQLTGLTLPASGQLRAKGRTSGGYQSGSSGLVETAVSFTIAPDIAVEHPSGLGLLDGTHGIDFGSATVGGSSVVKTFTIRNSGTADLTGLAITKDGTNPGDFTVSALSATSIPVGGSALTFTVAFAPSTTGSRSAAIHISSNVTGSKSSFDIVLMGTGAAAVQNPGVWQWNHPLPQGSHWMDVLWDGSRFVAVGDRQAIGTSPDGVNWSAHGPYAAPWFGGVAFNGSRYVAVGASWGRPIYSDDAKTWAQSYFPTGSTFEAVIWTGTKFLAVGWDGKMISSEDGGVNWTQITVGTADYYDVETNGSMFVAVGELGTLITSPDGASWQTQASGTASTLRAVVWAGSQWIASGDGGVLISSPDGITWTPRSSGVTNTLRGACWTGDRIIVVGSSGKIITSMDGIAWAVSPAVTTNSLSTVAIGGGVLVAAGDYGALVSSSDGGLNWTNRVNPVTERHLNGVTASPSGLVAVGSGGTILGSPDAVNWSARTSGTSNELFRVTWTGTRYVAVGSTGTIRTSTDGDSWNAAISGTTQALFDVTSMGSGLVAVGGSGTILTSPDGLAWTPRTSGVSVQLNAVTWTGTEVVAVGQGSTVLRSADGITWAVVTTPVAGDLYAVTWTGTKLLAVGGGTGGNKAISTVDFSSWSTGSLNLFFGSPRAVIWLGSKAVAVGVVGGCTVSTNLTTWQGYGAVTEPTGNELDDLAVFGDKLVAVGNGGTILVNQFQNTAAPEIAVHDGSTPAAPVIADGQPVGVAFGNVALASSSVRLVTIINVGAGDLTGLAVSKNGTHAGEFTVSSLISPVLSPGASTSFAVTFTPGAAGVRTAAIHIASNDADENTYDINLTGIGTVPEIVVEQPAGVALTDGIGSVALAIVSNSSKTFTIRNTGTADLTGLALNIGGPQAGSFVLSTLGTTSLAPGASTTFTVSRPVIITLPAGYQTATLHIASNDADENTFDIPLTYSYIVRWNWRQSNFNTTSQYGISGDGADPDGDGLSNLLEFATRSSPTANNAAPGQLTINGGNIEFTYTRANVALVECTFAVQWNDVLSEAGWSSIGVTEAIQSDDGVTQVVKATLPAGTGAARFVRLKVTGIADYIDDEGAPLGDPPPPPPD